MDASSRHQSDGCKCQSHGGAEVKHAPMNSIVHGAARPAECQQQSSSTSKQHQQAAAPGHWQLQLGSGACAVGPGLAGLKRVKRRTCGASGRLGAFKRLLSRPLSR